MINIGINGFGRIGKCVFLQLLSNDQFQIKCINASSMSVREIQQYLEYDSTHHYPNHFDFKILGNTTFRIGRHTIELFSSRNASELPWRNYGCSILVDATGAYLSTEKARHHDVDFVIMSAPPKDNTPQYIFGVNDYFYTGESVVSASSCTTNCITPLIKLLDDHFTIKHCVFTTIHSTTASQNTVDVVDKKLRTHRTILNNIIPHTTGASSSITKILPHLCGKVFGTSVRVPVLNSSMLDVTLELDSVDTTLDDIKQLFENHVLYNQVFRVTEQNLVSCDFITTTTPTILDIKGSLTMGGGRLKLLLWYDNEWSYSAQVIRLAQSMYKYNSTKISQQYFYNHIDVCNKVVMLRLDLNVPVVGCLITDNYRITSALPTIQNILKRNPSQLILCSHFGRPKGIDSKYSLAFLQTILKKYLECNIAFLPLGICEETKTYIASSKEKVFLLENLRFHPEETKFNMDSNITKTYKELADVFICDAFGCLHRNHMSIYAPKFFDKPFGFGHLIQSELDALQSLITTTGNILCIIGGNKIADKTPLITAFQSIPNATVFVTGGLAQQYDDVEKHNVVIMRDGYSLWGKEKVYIPNIHDTDLKCYDIGDESFKNLIEMVNRAQIIFWNGSLGWIEQEQFAKGSVDFVEHLERLQGKQIIIGGGETASLIKNKQNGFYISTGGGALLEYLQEKLTQNKNIIGLSIFEN
jgi:glyceraldehyde 3-phosphate dehydrogenase